MRFLSGKDVKVKELIDEIMYSQDDREFLIKIYIWDGRYFAEVYLDGEKLNISDYSVDYNLAVIDSIEDNLKKPYSRLVQFIINDLRGGQNQKYSKVFNCK
jgi:hypothetical protein